MTSRPGYGILSAMFWYVILMLFSPLHLMFGLVFRSDQARLVLALHHQVLILQRQHGKRPSLAPSERLALVLSGLLLGKEKLREALLIVTPETLVGWHRSIMRRHWRLLSSRKPGAYVEAPWYRSRSRFSGGEKATFQPQAASS